MLWSAESVLSFSLYFTQSRFLKAEAVVEVEILFVLVSMTWHTFPRISALIECQSVLALKSVVLGIDIMPGFRRKNCSNCSLCMPACTCVCYEYCTLNSSEKFVERPFYVSHLSRSCFSRYSVLFLQFLIQSSQFLECQGDGVDGNCEQYKDEPVKKTNKQVSSNNRTKQTQDDSSSRENGKVFYILIQNPLVDSSLKLESVGACHLFINFITIIAIFVFLILILVVITMNIILLSLCDRRRFQETRTVPVDPKRNTRHIVELWREDRLLRLRMLLEL